MAITHKFVSTIPDGGDATLVQPSNWNDSHDVTSVYATTVTATNVSATALCANSIQLQGNTASFPGIFRDATSVMIKRADESNYTTIQAADLYLWNGPLYMGGTTVLCGTSFTGTNVYATTVTATTVSATNLYAVSGTPANSSAAGTQGQIMADADYIYSCISANCWKRSALAGW